MHIRAYQAEDMESVIRLLRQLQDHIAALDTLDLNSGGSSFDAERYAENMMATIKKERGKILVAEEQGLIGFIAGVIIPANTEEGCCPTMDGRILELIVDPDYRGQRIGKALMEAMEQYFMEQQCDLVRVECFAPNTDAYTFYERCGYSDRSIDMIKIL